APVRPQSAPHQSAPQGTVRRPQSARLAGREDPYDDVDEEDCRPEAAAPPRKAPSSAEELRTWPPGGALNDLSATRGRRARPTSAKALKHRRVVDDGVDSIIYEDIEEEEEEELEELGEREERSWEGLEGQQDAGHSRMHRSSSQAARHGSGTGGCSSCSSLSSRSRPPSAPPSGRPPGARGSQSSSGLHAAGGGLSRRLGGRGESGSRSRGSSAVSEEGTLGEGACSENTSLERNPKILEQLERQQQMQLQQQQQLQQLQEQLQQQLSHAAAVSEARAPHGETEAAVASTEHE
ncbi:unnamed protein product, partial [Polarella glacialis]